MVECGLEIDFNKKLVLKSKKLIFKIINNVNLERLSNDVKINNEDLTSLFYDFE